MASLIDEKTEPINLGFPGESTTDTNSAVPGVHDKSAAAARMIDDSKSWHGVAGITQGTTDGVDVYGGSMMSGVIGESSTWIGVYGRSESTSGGAGVMGDALGPGVIGKSQTWTGVYGETRSTTGGAGVCGEHKANGTGVLGKSAGGIGVWGISEAHEAVHAESRSAVAAAIAAYNVNPNGTGVAVFAKKEGSLGHAGFFDGNVHITNKLTVQNIDVVEFIQALQKRLNDFESLVGVSFPPLAHISARQTAPAHKGVAYFEIVASGFRPHTLIHVNSLPINTDHSGGFATRVQLACFAGATVQITALDPSHPKGTQYSNTASIRCT